MADKVAIQVEANVAPAVQEYIKLLAKQQEAVGKVKDLDRAHSNMRGPKGGAGATASSGGVDLGLEDMKGVVAGLLGVTAVVATLKDAIDSWDQQVQRMADLIQKTAEDETKAAGLYGDASETAEIRDRLRQMGAQKPQVKQSELTSLFESVRAADPTAKLDDVMGIISKTADTKFMLGGDINAMKGVADYAGRLGTVMPNATPEDRVDVALKMQQELGKFGAKLERSGFLAMQQMVAGGMSPERAISLGISAVTGGGKPTVLEDLIKASTKSIELSKVPINVPDSMSKPEAELLRSRKAEQMGVIAYNQADEGTRVEMLLRNKNLRELAMGAESSKDVESMQARDPRGLAARIREAKDSDYVQSQSDISLTQRGEEGKLIIERYEAEAAGEKARLGDLSYLRDQVEEEQLRTSLKQAGASDFEIEKRVKFDDAKQYLMEESNLKLILEAIKEGNRLQAEAQSKRAETLVQNPVLGALQSPEPTGMLY